MPEELVPLKILCRDEYGDTLENMNVGDKIDIPIEDRQKILQFVLRKYGKDRIYRSFTLNGITSMYRLK